jgi:N-acetylmuramoyl-L-alanine amidase
VKKSLNIFLIVLFTIFGIFCADLHSTAYAQETINTPIMGESQATKEQAIQILKTNNSIKTDEYIEEFVDITWEEASIEGVREDIAFSLMMLETGWLKFGGAVAEDQNNFGGIGATDSGGTPASFPDIKTGIRAVVQHLKAYSSTQALNSECVDPRFELVKRGSAEYVEWLGIRENPAGRGWASGQGYGYKIINIINRMCGNNLSPFINKLSASRSDSVYTITAEGINASEALYKFVAINTATGQQTVLQDYSHTNSITWTPSSYGSYQIKAYIKSPSSPYEFDAYTTHNVTIEKEQPEETATTIESIKVDKANVYTGKPFTATAQASSQNKPLYKFWIGQQSSSGNWSWSVIQNYSEKNFVTYTINKPGNYRVSVYVKDSASSKDPEVLKQCDVSVGNFPTTIESIKVNKTNVYTGKSFTATAQATSQNKPLYKFWIGQEASDGNWSWSVIQNYSEKNSVTYTIKKAGDYRVSVYVKDSASSKDPEVLKQCDVSVGNFPTTIESIKVNKTNVYTGKSFTATAQATSQNKPLYKFWIGQEASDGNWSWSVIQNYSEKNSVTYTIKKAGDYRVSVYVKDSASSKDPETLKQCDVYVRDFQTAIESISVDKTEVYSGNSFTATAQAISLNTPLYKFYIGEQINGGNWSWTVIQNYSKKNSVTYTMKKPGHYRVSAYVKDSASSKDPEVLKQCDVYVKKIATIVLDAGHGGSDPGAVSSPNTGQIKEADLNLRLTNILGDLLEEKGFQIIYTRNNKSSNPTLQGRVAIANNVNADLFLSIHHDAAFINKSAHGISTHYSTYRPELDNEGLYVEYSHLWDGDITYDRTPCKAAVNSKILAEMLVQNIATLGFDMRPKENGSGAHDHNLYVTRMTTMPSVLIEAGFMSNDEEVLRVSDPKMERAIAQKIVETIVDFFER